MNYGYINYRDGALTLFGDAAAVRVGEAVLGSQDRACRTRAGERTGRSQTRRGRTMATLRDVTAEDFRRAEVMLVGSGDGLLLSGGTEGTKGRRDEGTKGSEVGVGWMEYR